MRSGSQLPHRSPSRWTDRPRAGQIALALDANFAAGIGELQLVDRLGAQLAQIDAAPLDGEPAAQPAAGEVEQVVDHARHPVGAGEDAAHHPRLLVGEAAVAQQHLGRGEDGGERVAQVVPDDADELLAEAGRLLLLGLAAFAVGDVGEDGDGARQVAGGVAQRGERERQVDEGAVLARPADLAAVQHLAAQGGALDLERVDLLLGRHVGRGTADHFLTLPAEQLLGGVVPDLHQPAGVERHDRQRGGLDERFEGPQRVAQPRLVPSGDPGALGGQHARGAGGHDAQEAFLRLGELPCGARPRPQHPEETAAVQKRQGDGEACALHVRRFDGSAVRRGLRGDALWAGQRRRVQPVQPGSSAERERPSLGDEQGGGVGGGGPLEDQRGQLFRRGGRAGVVERLERAPGVGSGFERGGLGSVDLAAESARVVDGERLSLALLEESVPQVGAPLRRLRRAAGAGLGGDAPHAPQRRLAPVRAPASRAEQPGHAPCFSYDPAFLHHW